MAVRSPFNLSEIRCSTKDLESSLILVGDTGVGKTTFIQYLQNYFRRKSFDDIRRTDTSDKHQLITNRLHPSRDSTIRDNTQQKSDYFARYNLVDEVTNKRYLCIDTFEKADSPDDQQNEMFLNTIIRIITQLDHLTSIVLLVNGSMNQVTNTFRPIINFLKNNLPDVFFKNVIVVLTHTKKHDSHFNFRSLNLNGNIYPFYMQNNAFVSNSNSWTKPISDQLQLDWNHSMNQIKLILETLDSFQPISNQQFLLMNEIRHQMKFANHRIRLETNQIEKVLDIIRQSDQASTQDSLTVNINKMTHPGTTVEIIQQIDAIHYSMICSSCHEVCHLNCSLNETNPRSPCLTIINGQCQHCEKRCSYANHYRAKSIIRKTRRSLRDVLSNLQGKYNQSGGATCNYQEETITMLGIKDLYTTILTHTLTGLKEKSVQLIRLCQSFDFNEEFKLSIQQLKMDSDLLKTVEIKSLLGRYINKLKKMIDFVEENFRNNEQVALRMQIIYADEANKIEQTKDVNRTTTSDLILQYHATTNHNDIRTILNELHRRSHGKSVSPLAGEEIITVNQYYDKYKHKDIRELSLAHHRLQKQIDQIVEGDILKIADVHKELLIENFVIRTAIEEKEKKKAKDDSRSCLSMPPSKTSPVIETDEDPYSANDRVKLHSLPYPTIESMPSPCIQTSIGSCQSNLTPYPTQVESSQLPPLPKNDSITLRRQHDNTFPEVREETSDSYFTTKYSTKIGVSEHNSVSTTMAMPMPLHTMNQQLRNENYNHFQQQLNNAILPQLIDVSLDCSSMPDLIASSYDPINLNNK